jgi:uncharacterized membrane protein
MSWGYWGIVTGLVVMLVLFFVSMAIIYHTTETSERGKSTPLADEGRSGKKHAA